MSIMYIGVHGGSYNTSSGRIPHNAQEGITRTSIPATGLVFVRWTSPADLLLQRINTEVTSTDGLTCWLSLDRQRDKYMSSFIYAPLTGNCINYLETDPEPTMTAHLVKLIAGEADGVMPFVHYLARHHQRSDLRAAAHMLIVEATASIARDAMNV